MNLEIGKPAVLMAYPKDGGKPIPVWIVPTNVSPGRILYSQMIVKWEDTFEASMVEERRLEAEEKRLEQELKQYGKRISHAAAQQVLSHYRREDLSMRDLVTFARRLGITVE